MKNIIKKIFIGICTVAFSLLAAFGTYGIIVGYIESFKAVGIFAILMFIYTTICLVLLLSTYYTIGDVIITVRELIRKRKNEEIKE